MAIGSAISLLAPAPGTLSPRPEVREMDSRSDESLWIADVLGRCLSGDAPAWEQIVQRYHRRIYNLCYRFAGSTEDAQDLTQEVFIKIYRTAGSFDSAKASFTTWLTTVTRNLLVDHYRRERDARMTASIDAPLSGDDDAPSMADRLASSAPSQHELAERRQRAELIHRALLEVSADLREAVILRDLQEMEYKEIAQVLGVPEGTVKSRINRGRAELARLLQRTYGQTL